MTETTKKNIYEKLQNVRLALSQVKLTKTGYNTHSKYHYFELGDFLPTLTQLMDKAKLCMVVRYGSAKAYLTIYNSGNPQEKIIFTTPFLESKVPGASDIQNLGASQTYTRRYLCLTAFEIVENDLVDGAPAQTNRAETAPQKQTVTNNSHSAPEANAGECPQCGKTLVTRTNKKSGSDFLACPGYPECKYSTPAVRPLPSTPPKQEEPPAHMEDDIPF